MMKEKEIVSIYLSSMKRAMEDAERALVSAGYDPAELMLFFQMQENEMRERAMTGVSISNSDYYSIMKNVEGIFDNRLTVFDSQQKDVSYRSDDTYRMSTEAFFQIAIGLGRKFEVHEKRHRQQHKELGGLECKDLIFAEGDAESFAVESLFSPASVKDAAIKYACLNQTLNRNNALKDTDLGCRDCAPNSKDYILYVLAPAVVHAMEANGASYDQIRERFTDAVSKAHAGKDYLESFRDSLLEGF